jgi:hypothetical protein
MPKNIISPMDALRGFSRVLKAKEHVNLPYTIGAEVNEYISVLEEAVKELEQMKKVSKNG